MKQQNEMHTVTGRYKTTKKAKHEAGNNLNETVVIFLH